MSEEPRLLLTPEMIRVEFLEAHIDATTSGKQE